jgi:hypothetical protein
MIKEKLIGRTLEVLSAEKSAIAEFISSVRTPKVREFLGERVEDILAIHGQSNTHNLRTMKQAIWEFERRAGVFTDEHWKKPDAIDEIFGVVIAISYEIRAGRILENELSSIQQNRIARAFRSREEISPSTPTG